MPHLYPLTDLHISVYQFFIYYIYLSNLFLSPISINSVDVIYQVHLSGKHILIVHSLSRADSIKPTFHGGHFTYNMPHGSNAIVQIFHLPWQRYSCQYLNTKTSAQVSQIRYSLVVIFELNSFPGVQYKNMMIIDDRRYQQE